MATDGYHIYYNANWTAKLTQSEIRGVLAHEVLHILFQHSDRRKARDAVRWNIATDIAINLMLLEQGFVLPEGGLASTIYWAKSAEEIYALLPIDMTFQSVGNVPFGKDAELSGIVASVGQDLLDGDDPRTLGIRDSDRPDTQQLGELCDSLRRESASKLQGSAADRFRQECNAHERSKVDWRALLREWMQERIKSDWSMWPYSKRHIHRGFFLPSVGIEAPGHIVFVIDTSGSMSTDVVSKILGELRTYRETFPCRLTVLQADTAVQSIQTYEEFDGVDATENFILVGRGGTDFRPVFNWTAENAPGALVVFATDGFGDFPELVPSNSVIWLLFGRHETHNKFPFGLCVDADEY